MAQTELRELRRRVQRIDQIRRLLDPGASPAPVPALPAEPGTDPEASAEVMAAVAATQAMALATQAQTLSAAIDAAQRSARAA